MTSTIYDVADKAGVSISTVSRVLSRDKKVNEETRQKILKVISELNFKPNRMAQALVANSVKLIEVCFSWSSIKINLENAWYSELLSGINEVAQEKQYGLLMNTISGVFSPKEVHRRVSQNVVDGLLLVSPCLTKEELKEIKNFQFPVVLIGGRVDDPAVDYVDCDNENAGMVVVDHLVKLGHKKIACITGEVDISSDASDRLAAFRHAMQKHRLKVSEDYVVMGDFSKGTGKKAMIKLLALKNRPTAVFASNDLMAMGACDSIREAGLKVGKDIALVGFDDIAQAGTLLYSLTTVRQDCRAIGIQAARILIEKMGNPDNWKSRHVLLPTQFVVRESCGSNKTKNVQHHK